MRRENFVKEIKTCKTCKRGQNPCMYVSIAQSARTTVKQKRAHDILCKNCPCCSPNGVCMKVINHACRNFDEMITENEKNK